MPTNPYAPPEAVIASHSIELPPRQVRIAVTLLWVGLLLSLPLIYLASQRTRSNGSFAVISMVFTLALTGLTAILYVCIHRGRNWARILLLAFTVIGLIVIPRTQNPFGSTSFEHVVNAVNWALSFAALFLLFLPKASAAWFKRKARNA